MLGESKEREVSSSNKPEIKDQELLVMPKQFARKLSRAKSLCQNQPLLPKFKKGSSGGSPKPENPIENKCSKKELFRSQQD